MPFKMFSPLQFLKISPVLMTNETKHKIKASQGWNIPYYYDIII